MLSIVLITSVTLLVLGIGASAKLVRDGRAERDWADLASSTAGPGSMMVRSFEEERRLSLLSLAGNVEATRGLITARQQSDQAVAAVTAKGEAARDLDPDGSAEEIAGYQALFAKVPTVRAAVDTRQAAPDQVFEVFSQVIGTIIAASVLAARVAPDARVGLELNYGVEALRAAEAVSIADTLGASALTVGELSAAQLSAFNRFVGEFRGEVAYAGLLLKGARRAQLQAVIDSPAWRDVIAMQDAILLHGPMTADSGTEEPSRATDSTDRSKQNRSTAAATALPISLPAWQEASGQVVSGLLRVWEDQSHDAHAIARADGDRTARQSLLGGAAVLLIAGLAFLAALALANRFIGRMHRLRADTLRLADEKLPELIGKLRTGESVDSTTEVRRLDFGTDELGQVADAFNRAHVAAVDAAINEAKTRAGVNAVFLNIAHRSQVVVHRQLTLLDQAERHEENADQLELLFQLDHLATRARRNAENLIILGGEQPGRRWRKPVPLVDLVRGAIAESLDYARIQTGRLPEVSIASGAVADLIHLLAELMDNATSFSPPQSRVEVTGAVVGRGVAVEVIDQGLGMSSAEIAERNQLLAAPPDFSVATLSSDTRLGLFVVAKLAAKRGFSVRLGESAYGGIRAVVLIPTALLEGGAARPDGGSGEHDRPAVQETVPAIDAAPAQAALSARPAGLTPRSEPSAGERGDVDRDAPARNGSDLGPRGTDARSLRTEYRPFREDGPALGDDRNSLGHNDSDYSPAGYDTVHQHAAEAPQPATTPDGRPSLPRRRRQSTAPVTETNLPAVTPTRARSADEARSLMSAIDRGSRLGRQQRPDGD